MIPRYTRPTMAAIWKDENKFRIWLDIELAACQAQHKLGKIPAQDLKIILSKADFNVKKSTSSKRRSTTT